MLKASDAKPEAWVRYRKEVERRSRGPHRAPLLRGMGWVGAAQNFFARFAAFHPSKPNPGLLGAAPRGPAAQGRIILRALDGLTPQPSIPLRSSRAKRSSQALTLVLWADIIKIEGSNRFHLKSVKRQRILWSNPLKSSENSVALAAHFSVCTLAA